MWHVALVCGMCYNGQKVDIKDVLTRKRGIILKRWFDLIVETYPADVANFLRIEKDRFTNPVGHILAEGTEILYDELIRDADPDRILSALDGIIRIRAVQDSLPSQAVAFIFLLKKVVREELEKAFTGDALLKALSQLETRMDMMSLLAFDIYMRCREEVHNIRSGEIRMERDMAMRLLNILKQPDKG